MSKTSQRQIVAEIRPVTHNGHAGPRFNNKFAQVSGGEITAAVEKVYDGGARFPEVLCAPSEIGDITVTRHFDPQRDGAALKRARQLVGQARYDIYVFTLNCDLVESGSERIYADALLIGLSEADGDSSAGTPATFSLTLSVSAISANN